MFSLMLIIVLQDIVLIFHLYITEQKTKKKREPAITKFQTKLKIPERLPGTKKGMFVRAGGKDRDKQGPLALLKQLFERKCRVQVHPSRLINLLYYHHVITIAVTTFNDFETHPFCHCTTKLQKDNGLLQTVVNHPFFACFLHYFQVRIRNQKRLRGSCTGYLEAFDKHFNLVWR